MDHDWAKAKASPEFLLESGLLFEMNRTFLHPLGISLVLQNDTLSLKDSKTEPDKLVFDRATMIRGQERISKFMQSFGFAQMDKRAKKLGWAVQPKVDPTKEKK